MELVFISFSVALLSFLVFSGKSYTSRQLVGSGCSWCVSDGGVSGCAFFCLTSLVLDLCSLAGFLSIRALLWWSLASVSSAVSSHGRDGLFCSACGQHALGRFSL
jgi:hypothetical protein